MLSICPFNVYIHFGDTSTSGNFFIDLKLKMHSNVLTKLNKHYIIKYLQIHLLDLITMVITTYESEKTDVSI